MAVIRSACAALLILGGITLAASAPAHAATSRTGAEAAAWGGSVQGNAALDIAETRAGDWYAYGAEGPDAFDCSGLVAWAAGQEGIYLPHSTYAMLAGAAHLERIPLADARRGDLLFYGPGHVEIDTIWYHMSFGAHDSGSRVGWIRWGPSWYPTMALRIT
jgi:cell wall-associated NlpC family hydrolase